VFPGSVRTILPGEGFAFVEVSDSAINKIHCYGDISRIVYPQEQPVDVQVRGSDAFVRFSMKDPGSAVAASPDKPKNPFDAMLPQALGRKLMPVEMYVYCGDDTYALTVVPVKDPTPFIVNLLSAGTPDRDKIREKESGLPYEALLVDLVKSAYKESPPSFYEVKAVNRPIADFIQGDLVKMSDWVGDRFAVSTFLFTNTMQARMNFTESQFMQLESRPLAIGMTHQSVEPGETVRIFVVRSRSHGD